MGLARVSQEHTQRQPAVAGTRLRGESDNSACPKPGARKPVQHTAPDPRTPGLTSGFIS